METTFLVDESLSPLLVKNYTLESQSLVIAFLHQEKALQAHTLKKALIISTAHRYRIRKG